jgi:hypothetical protein
MDLCGPIPPNESLVFPTNRNAFWLMRTIQNSVEPELWDIRGGPASIHYVYSSVTFVIRAPGELHLTLRAAGFGLSTK